ncbi:MAG: 4a-hydroxytetrahydrobiopterin dehydratase [Halobacteriales archaeon]
MADVLSDREIERGLPDGWSREGEEITRTYEFDDYLEGVQFAVECAEIADEEFHHPDLRIGFREIEIRLTNHEAGGITEQDLHMAELFDDVR